MTDEEKAANVVLLARLVMGWTQVKSWSEIQRPQRGVCFFLLPHKGIVARVLNDEQRYLTDAHNWDPYASVADAVEMLKKFRTWILRKGRTAYMCDVWADGPTPFCSGRCETGLDAITAACLEWARAQAPLDSLPVPDGWRRVDYREPKFNEYFLSGAGAGQIGYQDGGVSFKGRQAEHIIVEKVEGARAQGEKG